ncbi:MAG: LrgB family protein [Erysipelothrix sp.]|nr:LrgB family protein [Erysipelothrix sp.]
MKYFFGILITVAVFMINRLINKKNKYINFNPLIFSSLTIIIILYLFNIDFETYNYSARALSFLITPATVALAIPLYKTRHMIQKHMTIIVGSILMGVIVHAITIAFLSIALQLDKAMIATVLPKSVTTAIAKDLSLSYEGIQPITVALVIVTGIYGAIISPFIFRIFKIKEQGLALGVSAHAVGLSTAIQIDEREGTMATLALILTGLITVFVMPLMMYLLT